jgi:hypothetical protein
VALINSTGNPIVDRIEEGVARLDPSSDFYGVSVSHFRRDITTMVFGPERTRLLELLDAVIRSHIDPEPA